MKALLKQIESQLRGITLQIATETGATPYESLNAFGLAYLREEAKGNRIEIAQVWTKTGIVKVSALDQFLALIASNEVTGVRFESKRNYSSIFEILGTHE